MASTQRYSSKRGRRQSLHRMRALCSIGFFSRAHVRRQQTTGDAHPMTSATGWAKPTENTTLRPMRGTSRRKNGMAVSMLTQRYDNDHIEHTSYVLVASLFFAGDGPTSLRLRPKAVSIGLGNPSSSSFPGSAVSNHHAGYSFRHDSCCGGVQDCEPGGEVGSE